MFWGFGRNCWRVDILARQYEHFEVRGESCFRPFFYTTSNNPYGANFVLFCHLKVYPVFLQIHNHMPAWTFGLLPHNDSCCFGYCSVRQLDYFLWNHGPRLLFNVRLAILQQSRTTSPWHWIWKLDLPVQRPFEHFERLQNRFYHFRNLYQCYSKWGC